MMPAEAEYQRHRDRADSGSRKMTDAHANVSWMQKACSWISRQYVRTACNSNSRIAILNRGIHRVAIAPGPIAPDHRSSEIQSPLHRGTSADSIYPILPFFNTLQCHFRRPLSPLLSCQVLP